ncbi:hypothetical protein HID58_061649 [Brassica napus]|uniref:Uncharacterized protein n=1 Tax=Brassica napus TaxID=3708 RepID=A0ABQ7ZZC5_BRANA|nr:hypothetical protein HID58_061649 [Brassica napus]
MSSATGPRSTWRMDGQLRYDIAMNTIIIILITDAVLHMTLRAHKIPLADNVEGLLCTFVVAYVFVITTNCGYWLTASEEEVCLLGIYIMGRLGHTLGFCIFLCLLYSISHLAMYVALPCLLWLVPAMFAPCTLSGYTSQNPAVKVPKKIVTTSNMKNHPMLSFLLSVFTLLSCSSIGLWSCAKLKYPCESSPPCELEKEANVVRPPMANTNLKSFTLSYKTTTSEGDQTVPDPFPKLLDNLGPSLVHLFFVPEKGGGSS